MTGPSSQELQLQDEQMAFYQQGMQESQAAFAEHQQLLDQMRAVYSPILVKGPNQEGFSEAEKANLDAQAIQGTATNYEAASRAVNERMAAEGGDNPLPSGYEESTRASIAESAAAEESREESQIVNEDYAQGFKNFEIATSALEGADSRTNPVGFEDAATGAGSAAEKTASNINQEQNSWIAPVMGAIGAVGGGLAGNPKIFG